MRELVVRAINIDSWYWIVGLSALLFLLYIAFLPIADAFTVEEIEELQAEQSRLTEELAVIKTALEKNHSDIDESTSLRESLRNEIRLLKTAEADDEKIFAREVVLVQETANLKQLKTDRIEMLEEQSEKRQRVNSINDDVRYNVIGLEESEVELVSSEAINLQIDIDSLTDQLRIHEEINAGIDAEIEANDEKIRQYSVLRDKYQREYEAIQNESRTGWTAIASLTGAKQLAENFDSIIRVLEEQREYLEDEKKFSINARQTIVTVIETSTERLFEINSESKHFKRLIGLQLSNQCIKLIKNGFPTTCPTYYDLINIDQSEEYVSGFFVTDDDGFFHRAEPNYANSWRWYDGDDSTRVILDPPKGMAERIPMITITNNFNIYFKPGDFSVDDDGLRKYNKHRSIEGCKDALISSDVWKVMLTDTIEMLKTGCAKTTIQESFVDPLPRTEIDITTSPNWQYSQWMDRSMSSCKTICKQY